jgi:hypothetical protein
MKNYDFQKTLKSLYNHATQQYLKGTRSSDELFDNDQLSQLQLLGIKPIEIYDFVDDLQRYEEPDWETVFAIQCVRRDYLQTIQKGVLSSCECDPEKLPAKTMELDGIPWLPRIIAKAQFKLRGELHPNVMYGCAGDRKFLRNHDIHPADFLRAVWAWESAPDRLVQWIKGHRQ